MSNARRFGGAYSPGGPTPAGGTRRPPPRWSERAVRSPSLRVLLLFLAPTWLLFGALGAMFRGDGIGLLWLMGAYALLIGGAGLTRVGQTAAKAYAARAVARPPAWPRKLFGGVMIGLGVALCVLRATGAPVQAVIFGAVATGLHLVSFGLDPMRSKGIDGLDAEALDAAITRVETARELIGEMRTAAARFGDPALEAKVGRLAETAQDVLTRIEKDPRDLRRSRRFLAVYLVGARDATVQFAQNYDSSGEEAVRDKYAALLDDLETHFTNHRESLTGEDRTALDVEIEVLRDRLRAEGV
jgi:hypothetical protein